MHIDLPADLPRVMCERRRIVQVLNNLFFYAARHSPAGSPIRVAVERDAGEAGAVVRKTQRGGGHVSGGLGLIICKGLVEAHGGRVLTYDSLLRQVWHGRGHAKRRLVRAFMQRLRRKLGEDAKEPALIVTHRGAGYRMKRPGRA